MRIATFVINLDSSEARMASAAAQLTAQGIPFTRIPAIDGRGRDPMTFAEYDHQSAMAYTGRKLRGGEIACYLSHIRCIEAFLASDAEIGLVFEDDMKLEVELLSVLQPALERLQQERVAWDLINLSGRNLKLFTPLFRVGAHEIVQAHYFPMSTLGLVWSREGARRFLAARGHIYAPIDNELREWLTPQGRGLSTRPNLVWTIEGTSDIDHVQNRSHRADRSIFYGFLKQKRMWRNKLRALRHMLRHRLGSK